MSTLSHMLSNNGLCLSGMHSMLLLFLALAVNFDWFRILQSYTFLLKLPVLMHSYHKLMLRPPNTSACTHYSMNIQLTTVLQYVSSQTLGKLTGKVIILLL